MYIEDEVYLGILNESINIRESLLLTLETRGGSHDIIPFGKIPIK